MAARAAELEVLGDGGLALGAGEHVRRSSGWKTSARSTRRVRCGRNLCRSVWRGRRRERAREPCRCGRGRRRTKGRPHARRRGRRSESLGLVCRIARQLRPAAKAELVVVLVFLAAPRTNDHPSLQTPLCTSPLDPPADDGHPAGGEYEGGRLRVKQPPAENRYPQRHLQPLLRRHASAWGSDRAADG